jgi:glycosyltransferase involved in cell wall biosynthesis
VYVPNGVDLATWQPAAPAHVAGLRSALELEGRRVIAYAGTLSLQNHPVDLLLDALPGIIRREPRTTLLLIGGGEDLPMLRERVGGMGLNGAVRFTGHVSRPALRALMGLAELTIDPVADDPVARARSPLKIVESMALGIPVVTADVGDRRMLLAEGAAGLLVSPGDPVALEAGIAGLLAHPDALKAASGHAREHAQAFDWLELARRFETVYAL